MSIICAKWLPGIGFLAAKSRDRSYKPDIRIRKSFRRDVERLYLWDNRTKFSEGVNEFSVCVLSCSDESKNILSTEGIKLRVALFEKTAREAAKSLIDQRMVGKTLVLDVADCFLVSGKEESGDYDGNIADVHKSSVIVCIDSEDGDGYRESVVQQRLSTAINIESILDALSDRSHSDPTKNPLKVIQTRAAKKTTGQVVLCPKERTMHYRAIWCSVAFDLNKLNSPNQKTFFEIVSTRKLLSFNESLEMKETIQDTIARYDQSAFRRWKVTNLVSVDPTVYSGEQIGAGISFDVNTGHFHGNIVVSLNINETYDVFSFILKSGVLDLINSVRDVLVIDLVSVIDDLVGAQ